MLDPALGECLVERDGDGTRGGVAIFFEVAEDLVAGHFEDIDRRVDDANVGLVRDEKIDIFGGEPGMTQDILDGVAQDGDSPAKDGPAVHVEEMEALLDVAGGWREAAATGWAVEQIAATTIGAEADAQ